ncbi:SDR family NAD(P)-dependent oxidoreductase [Exilibacterium tricleocarpae]|uniref:SDR family NAD(P)-dependent oxidoreductase n=1 Tax=Exilibacterium tricleocarpae TaxID=2591008 RepID=A0A545SXL8_9GAMM|nr:SDR family NAD(P)-dependent oxidoreductase [Exilibacterium tricleocarpae]TQV69703.1 SDR family NAD(P)-dependent oxidoreductase [Exilibacterium tricleocarpae]
MTFRNIVIIGSSGAIGTAFAEHYAKEQNCSIHLLSRSETTLSAKNIKFYPVDYTDESSFSDAAGRAAQSGAFDLVVVATGLLHDETMGPEKGLRDLTAVNLEKIFFVNTIVPALAGKYFLPKLQRKQRAVFAALSARVGSIGDNRLGGWYGYRASKAALNMMIKTASIEMARRYKDAIVVGLHPGTVDSRLSKPFQRNVPAQQLFSPQHAVTKLAGVIENLTPADSGCVFAWDGRKVPC